MDSDYQAAREDLAYAHGLSAALTILQPVDPALDQTVRDMANRRVRDALPVVRRHRLAAN